MGRSQRLFLRLPSSLSGWSSSLGSLEHVQVSQGLPASTLDPTVASLMVTASGSGIPSVAVGTPKLKICDTGEPLSSKVMQQLQTLEFVELHEFLPAPLLRALEGMDPSSCPSHSCCNSVLGDWQKRRTKTVGDVFTWMLCFHRFTAAASTYHPHKVGQFMAYANIVVRVHLEFEGDGWRAYDCAFRLQASGQPSVDWSALDLPLYARIFTAQSRRRNCCRYCAERDHPSNTCPWGVDVALPMGPYGRQGSTGWDTPVCHSWNMGFCRFPNSCSFRHVCSRCHGSHRVRECPTSHPRQRPPYLLQWTLLGNQDLEGFLHPLLFDHDTP